LSTEISISNSNFDQEHIRTGD